jgi:hypothetical protein
MLDRVHAAAYSADGRLSAAVSGDADGGFAMVVKDAKTDDVVRRIPWGRAASGKRKQGPGGQAFADPGRLMDSADLGPGVFGQGAGRPLLRDGLGKGGGMSSAAEAAEPGVPRRHDAIPPPASSCAT